jgi:hypothetical protein
MRESAIWHRVSTPRVLAWFLGATSSWNDVMDLLWVPCRWIGSNFGKAGSALRLEGPMAAYQGHRAGS